MNSRFGVLLLLTGGLFGQVIVRRDLTATDLYYSKSANVLYVTTASTSAYAPNSILPVNPLTGADTGRIDAGDDPQMMAGSDDGRYAYVWLRGANIIRRFDLQARKSDYEFPATMTGALPGTQPTNMAVAPGDPETVVVSFFSTEVGVASGIAVFRRGVQLPDTLPELADGALGSTGCTSMTFGVDPSTGWCHNTLDTGFQLYKLRLDANGIRVAAGPFGGLADVWGNETIFYKGRLYFNDYGRVTDPEARVALGQYSGVGVGTGSFATDPDSGRIYFSRYQPGLVITNNVILAMDLDRFTPVAYAQVDQTFGRFTSCGPNGVAGIGWALEIVPLSAFKPFPVPTVGTVTEAAGGVRRLAMPADQIVYEPNSDRLFANVPASVPQYGNSLFSIDPNTLSVGAPLWVGGEPWLIRPTESGRYLYQVVGVNLIRRIDLSTFQPDLDIPVYAAGTGAAVGISGLVPLLHSDDSFAVARTFGPRSTGPESEAVAVYDLAVPRPEIVPRQIARSTVLAPGFAGSWFFGLDGATTGAGFQRYSIDPQGVTLGNASIRATPGFDVFYSGLSCDGDLCADSYGNVLDGAAMRWLGQCPIAGFSTPALDALNNRIYYLSATGSAVQITSCDLSTFLPVQWWSMAATVSDPGNLLLRKHDQLVLNTNTEIVTVPISGLAAVPETQTPQPTATGSILNLKMVADTGVYDPVRDRLYVALTFSSVGTLGNSIGVINPSTGVLESTTPVGGEPVLLALSSDASYLWVALANASTVVRLNLSNRSVDSRILLPMNPTAIAGVPGRPASLAIGSASYLGIYDGGVERSNPYTPGTGGFGPVALVFNSDGTLVSTWGCVGCSAGDAYSFRVSDAGLALIASRTLQKAYVDCIGYDLHLSGARLYTGGGRGGVCVLDLSTLALLDRVAGMASVAVDGSAGRLYGVAGDGFLYALDATSLVRLGKTAIADALGRPIVVCGSHGVAVLGSQGITFIPPSAMVPLPRLPQNVSQDTDGITRMSLAVAAVSWDSKSNRILAALSDAAGPDGNSIAAVDPATGSIVRLASVGNDPNSISLAPDAHVAYVGLAGSGRIGRVNLDSGVLEQSWPIPNPTWDFYDLFPVEVGAVSAQTNTVVVNANMPAMNLGDWRRALMVLDAGIARSKVEGVIPNTWGGDLYPSETYADGFFTSRMIGQVSMMPVHWAIDQTGLIPSPGPDPPGARSYKQAAACGSLVFLDSGQVWDPVKNQIVADYSVDTATFSYTARAVACDSVGDRAYFALSTAGFDSSLLYEHRISTGDRIGSVNLGGFGTDIAQMITAGANYIAIRTKNGMLAVIPTSLLQPSPDGPPSIAAVVNAASFQPGIAPGAWISIFGSNFAVAARTWRSGEIVNGHLPTLLDGVSVTVNRRPAAIYYASPTQLNVQVPSDDGDGVSVNVWVVTSAGSAAKDVIMQQVAPGLFVVPAENGKYVAAQHADWSTVGKPGLYPDSHPAKPGEVIVLYGTGFGPTSPAVPAGQVVTLPARLVSAATVTISGTEAEVQWAGVSGAGLWQFNVKVPDGLPDGDAPVVVKVDGKPSQAGAFVTIKSQ